MNQEPRPSNTSAKRRGRASQLDGSTAAPSPATQPPADATSEIPKSSHDETATDGSASTRKPPKLEQLRLADINCPEALVMRDHVDEQAVADYAEHYRREREGVLEPGEQPMPPCDLFKLPDGRHVRVNGAHRWEAMARVGIVEASFLVHEGTYEDAARFAATANRSNSSVRVTNKDKETTVRNLWAILGSVSANSIAELALVDDKTASKYRPETLAGLPSKGRDGKLRKPPTQKRTRATKSNAPSKPKGTPPAKPPSQTGQRSANDGQPDVDQVIDRGAAITSDGGGGEGDAVPVAGDDAANNGNASPSSTVSFAIEVIPTGGCRIVISATDERSAKALLAVLDRAESLGFDLADPTDGFLLVLTLGLDAYEQSAKQPQANAAAVT